MYHLISCSICKTASPPPADVGWSMSDSGISAVGRCRLEYELQKILTVGWGINYISHHYPLCDTCGAGEWKVLIDGYAAPQHPAAHYLKLTQNIRPTHTPTPTNHILVQNSTPVHSTLCSNVMLCPLGMGRCSNVKWKRYIQAGKGDSQNCFV